MKKILFSLVALVCSMSMNAQVMKVMKNGEEVAKYNGAEYSVVFEEAQAAKATIGGSEVDVNWVQLWAGGPKFADRNVEGTMTFTQAIADPFTWGSNWCTPSKADLDELVKAASNDADKRNNAKVTCTYEQVEGVWGFTFTGKEDGYTNNSVFFPAKNVDIGSAAYWSGSASGVYGCVMYLCYDGNWGSYWYDYPKNFGYLVRPVLKN